MIAACAAGGQVRSNLCWENNGQIVVQVMRAHATPAPAMAKRWGKLRGGLLVKWSNQLLKGWSNKWSDMWYNLVIATCASSDHVHGQRGGQKGWSKRVWACVGACVRARVCVCVCACARARVRASLGAA